MTQEFHISVTPVGDRDYLVRTERVEPGVPLAEEQVTWPVDQWLHQARSLMQDPLLQMLQAGEISKLDEAGDLGTIGDLTDLDALAFAPLDDPLDSSLEARSEQAPGDPLGNRASRSAQDLVSLGKELFSALFCDSLRDSWMMAQAIAQHRQEPLRLRLGIKGDPLNRLPWEVLHDLDQPLATGTNILFSRYRPSSLYGPRPSALAADEPLRILMVIASPEDQAELALAQETRELLAELQHSPTAMQISLLEHPDRHTLTQALEHGNYQIFHYSGHSVSGQYGGAVSLVSEKTGLTEMLSGEDLAGLLANNGIRLAVFNSCRGAHRTPETESSGASNLAEASIDRRIPAVLAMAERIPDDVALSLTRLFYRNLSQGVAIDLSLSRARQGLISSFGSRQLYWALPVFYLHPEFDGHLLTATEVTQPHTDRINYYPESQTPFTEPAPPDSYDPRVPARTDADVSGFIEPDNNPLVSSPIAVNASQPDLLPDRLPDDIIDGLTETAIATPLDERINATIPVTPTSGGTDRPNSRKISGAPRTMPSEATEDGSVRPVDRSGRLLDSSPVPSAIETSATSHSTDSQGKTSAAQSQLKSNVPSFHRTRRGLKVPTTLLLLGTGIAIAILGWNWWRNRPFVPDPSPLLEPSLTPKTIATPVSPTNSANLNATLDDLVSQASTQIARNDWAIALPTIEQLLELGAVERAGSLLALMPIEALDRGEVQFLKGRWAWQTRVSGKLDASYDDAWRYWAAAVERQPENLLYRVALGWAYYADDRLDEADRVWREAIAQLDDPATAEPLSITGSTLDRPTIELSLQAGLALALDRRDRSDAAIALRDLILAQNSLLLQPPQLAQNWLWSAEAIGQWQTLLARRPVFAAPPATVSE